MAFVFAPAVRENVGIVAGVAGPSGSGKTFTALRLATGLAGGQRFAVIDTEARRAKHYASRFKFDHGDLRPPFRPSSYLEAIVAADEAGYPVIVVDSMSHEHAGEGGLLDMHEAELDRMAGDDWRKREKVKFTAWIAPKREHKRMVSRLLQLRAHVILCFRAEQKTEIVRGEGGKLETAPKRLLSGFTDWIPVAEKNLLFELTLSMVLSPENPGCPIPIKIQEQHQALFPRDRPVDEESGRALAKWAEGGEPERSLSMMLASAVMGAASRADGDEARSAAVAYLTTKAIEAQEAGHTEAAILRKIQAWRPESAPRLCPECKQSPCARECSLQGTQPPA